MKALSEFMKSKPNFKFLDIAYFLIKYQNSNKKNSNLSIVDKK